jgi:hypothetical protein
MRIIEQEVCHLATSSWNSEPLLIHILIRIILGQLAGIKHLHIIARHRELFNKTQHCSSPKIATFQPCNMC